MPTRIDWLPYSITERAAAIRLIASRIDDFAAVLGLSVAQVDRIKALAEEYDFAVSIYESNRATNKALRAWRDSVISNKRLNRPAGERPVYNNTPAPAETRVGLTGEIRKFVELIKASPGYTDGVGTAMGILSPNHVKKQLDELRPKPKVTVIEGFRLKIASQMEGMDALQVEFRRNGEEKWQKVAFLTSLPETIYIEPSVRGVPESGLIRCFFLKKNKIVGQPSSMPPVTIFAS